MQFSIFYFFILLLISSCIFNKISKGVYTAPLDPQKNLQKNPQKNPQETSPENNTTESNKFIKLHIVSMNNFSGKSKEKTEYKINIGGERLLESYLNILKNKYNDNLLILDGGFFFDKNDHKGKNKIANSLEFLKRLPIDALLFTQYDLEIFHLSKHFQHEVFKQKFISSNIHSIGGGKIQHLKEVQNVKIVKKNDLNIAIFGLSHHSEKSPIISGHMVEDPVLSYLKLKKKLENTPIDLKIILMNIKSDCYTVKVGDTVCPKKEEDQLKKMLSRFPPHDIDLVILSGDSFIYDFILGIPVLQNRDHGIFLNRLDLFYDIQKQQIVLDKTNFLNPIKICDKFYFHTLDCDLSSQKNKIKLARKDNFKTIPAKFLGEEITPLD